MRDGADPGRSRCARCAYRQIPARRVRKRGPGDGFRDARSPDRRYPKFQSAGRRRERPIESGRHNRCVLRLVRSTGNPFAHPRHDLQYRQLAMGAARSARSGAAPGQICRLRALQSGAGRGRAAFCDRTRNRRRPLCRIACPFAGPRPTRHRISVRPSQSRHRRRTLRKTTCLSLKAKARTHTRMTPSMNDEGPLMKTSLDVVTYGEAMTLFVAAETGDLAKVGQFTKRVPGADLNVAIGLSRLGFRVGWMSRVGRDSFGRYVLDVLAQEGIDASCVTIDEGYPTGFQLKSKNDDGSDPAIEYFRKGSAASHLSLDDYVADYVLGARHLHLTGVAPAISATSRELAFHMAKEMRKAGKTISFDPNLRPTLWPSQEAMAEALNALATHADWVMPGVSEGKILTGFTKPEDIARFYLDQGAKGVVVKLGAHGAYFRTASNEEGT